MPSTARKSRAVSRAKPAIPPDVASRFVLKKVEGGSITSDANTDLEWSHTLFGRSVNHAGAQDLVDQINRDKFGGHTDWRLPTVDELFAIADRTKIRPAVDKDAFPDTKVDWYWTSTPCAGGAVYAWIVSFYHGDAGWYGRGNVAFVRAVRGSGALASQ